MSELAFFLGVEVGGTLPPYKFFRPKRLFINYMPANYRRTLVYDVGAGAGHVARALARAGVPLEAIDLYHQTKQEFPVTIADATTHKYKPGSVVMFCRPSHEGFVKAAIMTAMKRGVREVVYVGLPRNLSRDLGAYGGRFHRLLDKVGASGESLYVMPNKPVSRRESKDAVRKVAHGNRHLTRAQRRA